MSVRNPLNIFKDRIDTAFSCAYYIKKLRNRNDIVDKIYSELTKMLSPLTMEHAIKALILEMITNRKELLGFEGQFDPWFSLDYPMPINVGREKTIVTLGDFGLDEI